MREFAFDGALYDDKGAVRLGKVLLDADDVARSGDEPSPLGQGVEDNLGLRKALEVDARVVARVPLLAELLGADDTGEERPRLDVLDDGLSTDDRDGVCARKTSVSASEQGPRLG